MSRKSYLGGSTIIGPRDNPYRMENTPHEFISDYEETPRVVLWGKIAEDLYEELDGFDFEYLKELFSALQHAFLYGDLTSITRIAEDDEFLGNYTLRLMNKAMIGRTFDKIKGKVIIQREGKLQWDASQIVSVYRAMIRAYDAELDDIPSIHPEIQKLIDQSGADLA